MCSVKAKKKCNVRDEYQKYKVKCGYSFEGQSFETHKPEPDSFFFCRLQETKNLDIAHSHFMCLNMCAALTVWALLASVLPADHKSAAVILCKKPGFGSSPMCWTGLRC